MFKKLQFTKAFWEVVGPCVVSVVSKFIEIGQNEQIFRS